MTTVLDKAGKEQFGELVAQLDSEDAGVMEIYATPDEMYTIIIDGEVIETNIGLGRFLDVMMQASIGDLA